MTFWQHIEELRKVLLRSLYLLSIVTLAFLIFHESLLSIFSYPLRNLSPYPTADYQALKQVCIGNSKNYPILIELNEKIEKLELLQAEKINTNLFQISPGGKVIFSTPETPFYLQSLSPMEGLSTSLKLCFWLSLICTAPFTLLFFFSFIAPGLVPKEKKLALAFILSVLFFTLLGMVFAYFITLPIANHFLFHFNSSVSSNAWSLSQYMDYTLFLLLANGFAGSLFCFAFFLVHCRVLSPTVMRNKRRYVVIIIFILSALLTPPDVFTQCCLAFPLITAFEALIFYGTWRQRKKKKTLQEVSL